MRKVEVGQVFKSGRWLIRVALSRGGFLCFDVESPNGLFSDRSLQYDNGQVVWDYPERIPQTVKARVKELYARAKRELQTRANGHPVDCLACRRGDELMQKIRASRREN